MVDFDEIPSGSEYDALREYLGYYDMGPIQDQPFPHDGVEDTPYSNNDIVVYESDQYEQRDSRTIVIPRRERIMPEFSVPRSFFTSAVPKKNTKIVQTRFSPVPPESFYRAKHSTKAQEAIESHPR